MSSGAIVFDIRMNSTAVEAALTEAAAAFPMYVNSWLVKAATLTKEEMESRVNQGIGAAMGQGIKNNITATYGPGNVFVGPNSNVPYAIYLEKGTEPHRPPMHADSALAQWCEMKGLNIYAIAQSIAKKGTKAHPFVEPTYEVVKDPVEALFEGGVAQFVAKIGVAA
jgi:HK97 gp10 family phage protein